MPPHNQLEYIIQIFNAFNTNDLSIQPKDNDEASVQVIFAGHYTMAR